VCIGPRKIAAALEQLQKSKSVLFQQPPDVATDANNIGVYQKSKEIGKRWSSIKMSKSCLPPTAFCRPQLYNNIGRVCVVRKIAASFEILFHKVTQSKNEI
jgi:hypothetical protein